MPKTNALGMKSQDEAMYKNVQAAVDLQGNLHWEGRGRDAFKVQTKHLLSSFFFCNLFLVLFLSTSQ